MGRAALMLALLAGPAAAQVYDCGLDGAPAQSGIAGPLVLTIDPAKGHATVLDPMTRYYAGGAVPARLSTEGEGWRLAWRLDGVEGRGAIAYGATLAGGKLTITATGGGKTASARGTCWAR